MASTSLPLLLAVFGYALAAEPVPQEKTQVTVYFESYCPDSVKFLTTQLFPAYATPLKEHMNVTLVPYGKAETMKSPAGDYTFTCHHGEKECQGNKVIACVLKDTTVPLSEHFKFINCTSFNIAANTKLEEYPVKMCATKQLTEQEVLACAASQGSEYLAEYGNVTSELTPKLTSVPTVVFNGKFELSESKMAVMDFRMALCSKIMGAKPAECMKNSANSLQTAAVIPLAATIFAIFRI